MSHNWEPVVEVKADSDVRRLRVPGGWLYQVVHHAFVEPVDGKPGQWLYGWHAPVFVPDVSDPNTAAVEKSCPT